MHWHIGVKESEITYVLKIRSHLWCGDFRLRKVYCLCKSGKNVGLGLGLVGSVRLAAYWQPSADALIAYFHRRDL